MSIELVRIDDRLIHGQIVMAWHKVCPVERMVVVDDKAASDAIRKMLLETIAPPGVAVSVLTFAQGSEALLQEKFAGEKVMLLVTTPVTLLKLVDCGISLELVNVGGMGVGPGKKYLTPAVAVDSEQEQAFKELKERGVKMQVQIIPSECPLSMNEILK